MMGSVDNKKLIWNPVENNSCISYMYHEITTMLSLVKIIYCNTFVDDVDSQNQYFDMFEWRHCSMSEEVRNTTMQYILSYVEEQYWILIFKVPK